MPHHPELSKATTATRAGCGHRELGKKTPFSCRGRISAAEDDPRHRCNQGVARGAMPPQSFRKFSHFVL